MEKERTLYRKGGTYLIRDEEQVLPGDPYYDKYLTDIIGAETIHLIEEYHKKSTAVLFECLVTCTSHAVRTDS